MDVDVQYTIQFRTAMDKKEMFKVLKTCIIGESFRECGVGYDPEDALETYHVSEFLETVDADDVTGSFSCPEQFLEDLCSTNAGSVYETVHTMEKSWQSSSSGLVKPAQRPTCKTLWDLGNAEALKYIDDFFGEDTARDFLDHGSSLFDDL